jgi:transposase-like protein
MPLGRPSNYTPELGERAARIVAEGGSLRDAARALGVATRQLHRWKRANRHCAELIECAAFERLARRIEHGGLGSAADVRELRDLITLALDRTAGTPRVRDLIDALRKGLADGRSQ